MLKFYYNLAPNPTKVALCLEEMGLKYDEVVATAESFTISGEDALTKEPIKDPKVAAQIWVKGDEKVMSFASINNMMAMLQKLKADGKTATSAIFVHDYTNGWKLFAENSFFARKGNQVVAFLTEKEAQLYADKTGSQVATFKGLQDLYAKESRPLAVATR